MLERIFKWIMIILIAGHLGWFGYHLASAYREISTVREIAEEDREFSIQQGSALTDILERLHKMELAPSPLYVRFFIALRQVEIVAKKGHYRLPERASTWDLLALFDEGRVELHRITIPEGLDKWQTAELLGGHRWGDTETFMALIEDPAFIKALDPSVTDLEGYLFPETYFFPRDATPRDMIQTIVGQFIEQSETLRKALPGRGLTVREWVTLASLIERESSVPEERPLIGGVFENRLKKRMLLQCDPTIIYSLKRDNRYRGKIYKSDILYDSSYNTYVYAGLPPGPIASPGLESLRAALYPENTPYLYFVAKQDGTHYFSKSLSEHNRAVRRFRRP